MEMFRVTPRPRAQTAESISAVIESSTPVILPRKTTSKIVIARSVPRRTNLIFQRRKCTALAKVTSMLNRAATQHREKPME